MACQKTDELPPIITLSGSDTVFHILNTTYNDAGATATDEFEGNVSTKIYIDNPVDVDLAGEYVISYNVVDEAGNEAATSHRWVFVYNTAYDFIHGYNVTENRLYPEPFDTTYLISIITDTLVNNRILMSSLINNFGQVIYADISDTTIVVPFQEIADSLSAFTIQGSGYVTDSTILLDYKKTDTILSLWEAYLEKL